MVRRFRGLAALAAFAAGVLVASLGVASATSAARATDDRGSGAAGPAWPDLRIASPAAMPFVGWLVHRSPRAGRVWLLLWPAAIVLTLVVVNAGQGTLVAGGTTTYPLLRDYTSLILLGALALAVPISYLEVSWIESFLRRFAEGGLLPAEPRQRAILRAGLRTTNEQLRRIGRGRPRVLFLVFAIGWAALLVHWARGGIYGFLRPPGSTSTVREFALAAYGGWWARPGAGTAAGFVAYFVYSVMLAYLIAKQNVVGVLFTHLFVRLDRAGFEYSIDFYNEDGWYGWGFMRRLLLVVYVNSAGGGIGYLALLVFFSPGRWVIALAFAPLWAAAGWYIWRSADLHRRAVNGYRHRERARLLRAIDTSRAVDPGRQGELVAAVHERRLADVLAIRPRLFRTREAVVFVLVYLSPAVITVVSFVRSLGE